VLVQVLSRLHCLPASVLAGMHQPMMSLLLLLLLLLPPKVV
jgi:hypothetical protein